MARIHPLSLPRAGGIAVAISLALLAGGLRAAEVSDAELAAMVSELAATSVELREMNEKIPTALAASIALKRKHDAEAQPIVAQMTLLDQTDGAEIDAAKPAVDAVCDISVPENQLSAVRSKCAVLRKPFNDKVDAFNIKLDALNAKLKPIQDKEAQRVAQITALQQKRDSLTASIESLKARIRAAKMARCQKQAAGGAAEEAAHALSVCFDGADNEIAGLIGTQAPKPNFSAVPGAPEETGGCDGTTLNCRINPSDLRVPPPPPPPPGRN